MKPKRIQRRRTKGWRMPAGAIYVGRPSRWGNDTRVGDCLLCAYGCCEGKHVRATPKDAVREFRTMIEAMPWWYRVDELRGHDLACWCPLDQPCHADVLLELANR